MNPQPRQDHGIIFLEADASNYSPRPAQGAALKSAQEYLEKLKQYAPEEYAKIMKQRELRAKKGNDNKDGPS
jgi:hypothetical protein